MSNRDQIIMGASPGTKGGHETYKAGRNRGSASTLNKIKRRRKDQSTGLAQGKTRTQKLDIITPAMRSGSISFYNQTFQMAKLDGSDVEAGQTCQPNQLSQTQKDSILLQNDGST